VGAMKNHHLAVRLNRKKYMKKITRPAAIFVSKEEKAQETADADNEVFHKKASA